MKELNTVNQNIEGLKIKYPILKDLIKLDEVAWSNPKFKSFKSVSGSFSLNEEDINDAENRLNRFAPFLMKAFPSTFKLNGVIESPLRRISVMKKHLESKHDINIFGELLLKCDNELPISGSIKARGGIYEVLKHAEELAIQEGLLTIKDDYTILFSDKFRLFFSKYSIAVGSTGNLGLSIGIISARLGFKVSVHMSADAKKWKKDLLRKKGVIVIEYENEYSKAVEEGRRQAKLDERCYFIDDENSKHLFLGYAVAASRLKKQLYDCNIIVDQDHPLFVYLPCGVGGGPGGIAFGLKMAFKDHVHCFFVEPTHSPAMLLGLVTGLHNQICVQDIGIDNITAADGLAVGRPSGFVGKIIEPILSGAFTVSDEKLYTLLAELIDVEKIYLEPSALAGFVGPLHIHNKNFNYIENNHLKDKMNQSTHIIWATGGNMVPKEEMKKYYKIGKDLISS